MKPLLRIYAKRFEYNKIFISTLNDFHFRRIPKVYDFIVHTSKTIHYTNIKKYCIAKDY